MTRERISGDIGASASASARRAARAPAVGWLGRIGLAAQGCCFLTIGVLALALATGVGGEATDPEGALISLARGGWTRVLLVVLAIGFACYAIWRLAQAMLDRGGMGSDAGGVARRGIQLVQGLTYLALTVSACTILVHSHTHRSSGAKGTAAGILGWPAGRELVGAIGIVFAGIAIGNAYWGVSGRFLESMQTSGLAAPQERVVRGLGTLGFLALAAVFVVIGWFLVKSAVQFDPHDAVGIGGALARLSRLDYGKWLLGLAAAGVFAYGVFGFVQARYHRA